jgi:hypothetical protein
MQSRLAAGELEDLDASFAIDYALNAALEVRERHGIDVLAGADRRIRIAGWTGEVAGVDDLDERETGGKFFERRVSFPGGVPAEGSTDGAVARPAGIAATIATVGISRIALGEPVKARVRADAAFRFTMNWAIAPQKNLSGRALGAPDLSRAWDVAFRATARRALQEFPDGGAAGGGFHRLTSGRGCCEHCDATRKRKSTQRDLEDDPEQNAKEKNLGRRLPDALRENESRHETSNQDENDHPKHPNHCFSGLG